MSNYQYIEQFLKLHKSGFTINAALVESAYELGLITRQEKGPLVGHLNESGLRFPHDWQLPKDKFEQVIFLTAWNEWVQCVVSKLMHNAMIFSMMESEPNDERHHQLIHHFPTTLDELSLEYTVDRLMQDKSGHERKVTMHVNVLNRRSLFAIQCMLSLPQREIRRILKKDRTVTITLLHSGNGKFTKLKKLMQPYGLELEVARRS